MILILIKNVCPFFLHICNDDLQFSAANVTATNARAKLII